MQEMGTSVEVFLTRMEGKIDLLTEKYNRSELDLTAVRARQGELATSLAALTAADIPNKISILETRVNRHSDRINAHDLAASERKGIALASRWVYVGLGGLLSTVLGLLGLSLRIFGG